MKVGLLADIHGNAQALAAVLDAASAAGVSRLLIAGDFVGYYHEPGRVMALLADWNWDGVRGNHDEMLRGWPERSDADDIRRRYGSGLDVAVAELARDQVDILLRLPQSRDCIVGQRHALLCHGAPWDADMYVYPDAPADLRSRLAAPGRDLTVFGHTHYPVEWSEEPTLVINPGSVGQPRDRKPGACWALWDVDEHKVTLRRETYDMAPVIARAAQCDPDLPFLSTVLTRTH